MQEKQIVDPTEYKRYLGAALKMVKAEDEDSDDDDDGEGNGATIHFALVVGAKPAQHRLGLSRTEEGKTMVQHLLHWTKLRDYTFGTASCTKDTRTTLTLDAEHNVPAGAKKKAQALLNFFEARKFSKVALLVEGKEVVEDDDDRLGDDSGEGTNDELLESKDVSDTEPDDVETKETTADPEMLKTALEKLKPALMKAIQAHPELRDQLMAPITVFAGQMKIEEYDGAKASLEQAVRQVQAVLGAPVPKSTPQVDQNTPQQKKDFDTTLRQVAPLLRMANAINAATPEMQDLKNRLLKAEDGMKAAAGRTDYEAALKFAQALQIVAQRLTQVHNTAETAQRNLTRQQANKFALTRAVAGLNGAFTIRPEDISPRNFDIEAKRLFPKGGAQAYADMGLKPGQEFVDFLNRLNELENEPTPENADAVEQAANAYLAHQRSLNVVARNSKESKQKREIAEQTKTQIAQYRQMMTEKGQQTQQRAELGLKNDHDRAKTAIEQAGDPPWDPVLDSQLQGHHATLTMLSARQQNGPDSDWRGARDLHATGDSQSFWINGRTQDGGKEKKFFFKPLEAEDVKYGMPRGGMAAREIVAKTVSDRLSGKTGLDFGMPSITPAILPGRFLRQDDPENQGDPNAPIYGSMQSFVKAPRGALGSDENRRNLDQVVSTVPKEETQKVALLDMILLNTDRNGNNLMLGGPIDQPPTLVPIDQGLCLPTRKVLNGRGMSMANQDNALLSLPGANEKFSDEMVAKLSMIAPDDIVQSVGAGRTTMTGTGRQDSSTLLSDESVQLSTRALAFVKKAAPHLTIKEIFNALGNDTKLIFDSKDEDMEEAFTKAMDGARNRVKALEEINTPPWSPQSVVQELQKLGWGFGMFGDTLMASVQREAESWLKIVEAQTENPLLRQMILEDLNTLGNPPDLTSAIKDMPLPEAYAKVYDKLSLQNLRAPPKIEDEVREFQEAGGDAVLNQVIEAIPDMATNERPTQIRAMKAWPNYVRAGGDDAYYECGGTDKMRSVKDRIEFMRQRRSHKAAFQMLADEKGFDDRIKDQVLKELGAATRRLTEVRDMGSRSKLMGQLSAIHELTDGDQFAPAVPLLRALAADLTTAGV